MTVTTIIEKLLPTGMVSAFSLILVILLDQLSLYVELQIYSYLLICSGALLNIVLFHNGRQKSIKLEYILIFSAISISFGLLNTTSSNVTSFSIVLLLSIMIFLAQYIRFIFDYEKGVIKLYIFLSAAFLGMVFFLLFSLESQYILILFLFSVTMFILSMKNGITFQLGDAQVTRNIKGVLYELPSVISGWVVFVYPSYIYSMEVYGEYRSYLGVVTIFTPILNILLLSGYNNLRVPELAKTISLYFLPIALIAILSNNLLILLLCNVVIMLPSVILFTDIRLNTQKLQQSICLSITPISFFLLSAFAKPGGSEVNSLLTIVAVSNAVSVLGMYYVLKRHDL